MTFLEKRKKQMNFKSAGELLKGGLAPLNVPELVINGPELLDMNVRKWQKGDFIGLIGSSGIGKTSYLLWIFKHILLNNPEGVVVFAACEMSMNQILNKWAKATKDSPEISDRLFIITSHDENGNTNDMSIKGVKDRILQLKTTLDTEVLCFCLDHLHIIKRAEGQTIDDVCYQFSSMCKELNSLGFLTAQTTKGKSGEGDMPLDKNAVFGTSAFTWEAAYIITLCQPLKTLGVQDLPITSWQLAKNRFKEKDDKHVEGINYLLKFDYKTEGYSVLTKDESYLFDSYYKDVIEARKAKEKTGEATFDTSYTMKGKDGREVTIVKEVSDYGTRKWD